MEDIPPTFQKIHIYNNNRHLQKSSSAGNFSLFFEPYFSELKNATKNKLFKKKPVNKTIIHVEYIDLPVINNNLLQNKLSEKEKKDSERKVLKLNRNRSTNNINLPYLQNEKKGQTLGEIYAKRFLSRDEVNDENAKIRKYYINKIDQQIDEYEAKDNYDRLFNFKQMRNNPRQYTSNAIKRNNNILNDVNMRRQYRQYLFFQNLKKYVEPMERMKKKPNNANSNYFYDDKEK